MWLRTSDSPYRFQRSENAIELLGDETTTTGRVWVTRTEAEGAGNKCMDLENHKNAVFIFPYIFTNQISDSSGYELGDRRAVVGLPAGAKYLPFFKVPRRSLEPIQPLIE